VFVAPEADVKVMLAAVVPFKAKDKSSVVAAIAALLKFKVVVSTFEYKPMLGKEAKLLSVKLSNEDMLLIVVTPVAFAMLTILGAASATVKLNVSIPVDVNVVLADVKVADKESVPVPPVNTSPILKEFEVDASNESSPEPPVNVLTPVVKAKDLEVLVVAVTYASIEA
jgi:hypothetical protein